jgi:hypothetical protein
MTISEQVNGVLSRGRDIAGTVNVVKDFLPPSIKGPLEKLFGIDSKTPSGDNPKNVSNFIANLNRLRGVQRTSHFYVNIPMPRKLSRIRNASTNVGTGRNEVSLDATGGGTEMREIGLLCESCSLPGVSLNTTEIRRYGYGVAEKKPYLPTFTDQSFTFIGDNTGKIHKFFYRWMNSIVRYDGRHRDNTVSYELSPFQVEYKRDELGPLYTVDIQIVMIDETNRKINTLTLMDAYPIFLGDVQLSWAENDSFVRFPVTFTFSNWKLDELNVAPLLDNTPKQSSLLQQIMKVGSAVQVLASTRKPTGVADIINVVNNARIVSSGLNNF